MFYEKTVLDNGVTVLTEKMEGVHSVALGLWFSVGSRDETPEIAGMSHFMEHMTFKGTTTRNSEQISADFERIGAELNAFTTKEYTVFYARFISDQIERATSMLCDMVVNSTFPPEEIESDEVVIEEIARSEDTPDDHIYDLFSGALMPKNTLGRPIIGTRQTVASFDHDACVAFHDARYLTNNLTVVASGEVNHVEFVRLCERNLSGLKAGPRIVRAGLVDETPLDHVFQRKDTEQAHVVVGMRGREADHPDRYTSALINLALGGGMSSRLFQEVREKRGLAYAIFASHSTYSDAGQFAIYAGTRPSNIVQVVKIIHDELRKIVRDGITADELERVRGYASGQLALSMEETRNHMFRLGRQASMGSEISSFSELLEHYQEVTLADCRRVAADMYDKPTTLAIISPLEPAELETMLAQAR